MEPIPTHGRFDYSAIRHRPPLQWPDGARLAVHVGFNLEHFAFGEGLGARIAPASPEPDVLNHSWREYGNRVGVWRCLDPFDHLALPNGALVNTALYEHCPKVVEAFAERGDGLIDTAAWRVKLQDYFPVARFGASFYVNTRDRFSFEASAITIDEIWPAAIEAFVIRACLQLGA